MSPEQKKANRVLWDAVKITDPRETKQAKLPGGFSCTSVDFGYLQERATEVFGPAGIGYGWSFPFPPQNVGDLAVVSIRFWYKHPETGDVGSYDVVASADCKIRRKEGDQIDTDAFKKALTDAVKLALKKVGFMADIYGGMFEEDGYKDRAVAYLDGQKKKELEALKAAETTKPSTPPASVATADPAPEPAPATVATPAADLTAPQRANVLLLRLEKLDAAKAADCVATGKTGDVALASVIANILYDKAAKLMAPDKMKTVREKLPKTTDGKLDALAAIGYLDGILGAHA